MFKYTLIQLTLGLVSLTAAQNPTTQKVGWTGTLSSLDGGLGGVVTVTNSTSLTISSYTLKDASAPALYWWGTTDGVLSDGFRISNERISHTATSDMLIISLDAGKTTADFNTVGLWCEQMKANFGQATLAEATTSTAGSAGSSTGSAPAATSSKSGASSDRIPYVVGAATLLGATIFATWMD